MTNKNVLICNTSCYSIYVRKLYIVYNKFELLAYNNFRNMIYVFLLVASYFSECIQVSIFYNFDEKQCVNIIFDCYYVV